MEGLIEYWPFWAVYFIFALSGYWCWQQMFFWLPRGSEWRRFLRVPGAVILFTPAPVAAGSSYFAPAVFVVLLDLMSGKNVLQSPALIWLLAACMLGMLILVIRSVLVRIRAADPES